MMSRSVKEQNVWQATLDSLKHLLGFMATPLSRIFSPSDDDYPATGIQPFEGDPADKHQI